MGFFDGIFQPDSLNISSNWVEAIGGVTSSGVEISPATALRHTAVFACNRVLSESISSLPLTIFQEDGKGNRSKAKTHPLYDLLHATPNDETTTMQWRETMVTSLNLRGNHYSQIIRDGAGRIVSIWGLMTDRMIVQRLEGTGELVFRYNIGGGEVIIGTKDVLKVRGLSIDGITGISPITYNRESLSLSKAMEIYGGKYFKNGATSTGAFSVPGELSAEAYARLKADFEKSYMGMTNAHKPMILEGGARFEKITMSNEDSQFLDSRKYQRSEIASIFRVPAHMINDLEKATFSNIEQMSLDFAIYTLTPWLVRIEQAMNRDLLTKEERAQGYYVKHNLAGLLRGDTASRAELNSKYVSSGIFTINDVLSLEDMNGIDNGNERYMPMNMTTIDNIHSGNNLKTNQPNRGANNA